LFEFGIIAATIILLFIPAVNINLFQRPIEYNISIVFGWLDALSYYFIGIIGIIIEYVEYTLSYF